MAGSLRICAVAGLTLDWSVSDGHVLTRNRGLVAPRDLTPRMSLWV